eukprot:5914871-Pyramimonas_sp.AAC.1
MGGYQARCRAGVGLVAPCHVYEALYLAGLPAYASNTALLARCRAVGSSVVVKRIWNQCCCLDVVPLPLLIVLVLILVNVSGAVAHGRGWSRRSCRVERG